MKTFYEWNFFNRGGNNWIKKSGDNNLFTCTYSVVANTTTITISRPGNFVIDFPCSFSFDTLNYKEFSLKKSKDNLVTIIGECKDRQDTILATNQKLDSLFKVTNPYDKLLSLTKLKDSLGVIGITSYDNKGIGNFIQFILSRQHILTYFPDSLYINNKYWKEDFSRGKMINEHWNYRKLDGQIDNG